MLRNKGGSFSAFHPPKGDRLKERMDMDLVAKTEEKQVESRHCLFSLSRVKRNLYIIYA